MTPIRTASRLDRVKPSITLAVTAKAAELVARGVDMISFGAGQPDFDTPEHIKDAARAGLESGVAKYTHVQGIVPLREAIAAEMKKAHGLDFGIDQILVSCGAKHSLFNLFMSLLDDGDEVVIPAPYWVSYPSMVQIAGGNPVILETSAESGFQLDPKTFEEAIGERTRAIIINTPSNPTGALYGAERLREIGTIAAKHGVLIVADDIYRSLVYGDAAYTSMASLSPEIAAHTILIDGVSKTYAMTGWRIGYTAAPIELIKAMSKIQGQSTSNASHISQVAALAAIAGPQDCVAEMRTIFDERRRTMVAALQAIPDVQCAEPRGAFYAVPDLSAYIGRQTQEGETIGDDVALAEYLVEKGVALVPGSGFGAPGFARLSYACSMDDINRGVERIKTALMSLR